ncbi:hypothetical protein [Pseudonocardia spinosispora]|uniref:hypothetical protein n=1 Tax=Pseudonocardia spinosispora TaxID=103441 RepID=UPI0003F72268|nr:hypothetical protein [Pseudonocardia spinosispora]
MIYPLEQYTPEVARYSAALLHEVDGEGDIRNLKGFEASALGMGATSNTEPVVMSWAEVLACTHAEDDVPIGRFIERIPDEEWREPTRRHASALINTARMAIGSNEGFEKLTEQMYRAVDMLGNDIWWLIMTMAQTTGPVATTLGGIDAMAVVAGAVRAHGPRQLPSDRALGPAIAGLSAIRSGHSPEATAYLDLCEPHDLLAVLLPLAHSLLDSSSPGTEPPPAEDLPSDQPNLINNLAQALAPILPT